MQGFNVIMVFNQHLDNLLMCRRLKHPYKGLDNLVGGKIEPNEDGLVAAYRELEEETGITSTDVQLHHMMDFTYYYQKCYVEVYVGRLNEEVPIHGEENPLYWSSLNHDFFDMNLYAGEGNIGHMIEQVKLYKEEIFGEDGNRL